MSADPQQTETSKSEYLAELDEERDPVLFVRNLSKFFPVKRGVFGREIGQVRAVDDVSFFLRPKETLGLVGESGCGKTTTGRLILQLIRPSAGVVNLLGSPDLTKLSNRELLPYRRKMQMIFQDPYSSLNPRMTVGSIIGEALTIHKLARGRQKIERVQQ